MRRESIARASACSELNCRWGWACLERLAGGLAAWLAGRRCCQSQGFTVGVCHTCAKAAEFNSSRLNAQQIRHGCSFASEQVRGKEEERMSGGDSIFTVCLRACRGVLRWNKFRTPQRYVKTGVTGEEGQSERRSGTHSH